MSQRGWRAARERLAEAARWLPALRRREQPPDAAAPAAPEPAPVVPEPDPLARSDPKEWDHPEIVGVDVPAGEVVSHLDHCLFAPYLGSCDTLLEIGAGDGRFTAVLLPRCRRLIAVDTSSRALEELRTRFGSSIKLEPVVLAGTGLEPVDDHSVDRAFSFGVFGHLSHRQTFTYLAELRRVLRPGGKAVIQHANTFSDLGWRAFLDEGLGPTVMTPDLMRELCHRAGLKFVDCVTDVVRRDAISLLRC